MKLDVSSIGFLSPYLEHLKGNWDSLMCPFIQQTSVAVCLASAMTELSPLSLLRQCPFLKRKEKVFKGHSQRVHPFLHLQSKDISGPLSKEASVLSSVLPSQNCRDL